MRTTLDIADDVLAAARECARREHSTIGEVLSRWARAALIGEVPPSSVINEPAPVYGFRPFPSRGGVVTTDLVNRLRDDDAY